MAFNSWSLQDLEHWNTTNKVGSTTTKKVAFPVSWEMDWFKAEPPRSSRKSFQPPTHQSMRWSKVCANGRNGLGDLDKKPDAFAKIGSTSDQWTCKIINNSTTWHSEKGKETSTGFVVTDFSGQTDWWPGGPTLQCCDSQWGRDSNGAVFFSHHSVHQKAGDDDW